MHNSLKQFKLFAEKDFISPVDITENLCKRFRQYLLDKYTGQTPDNYFTRFRQAVKAAYDDGYFAKNPSEKVCSKSNPSKRLKANLEVDEYLQLLCNHCLNEEVKAAFLFSCYTGLRWVDVKKLEWNDIKGNILTADRPGIDNGINPKTGDLTYGDKNSGNFVILLNVNGNVTITSPNIERTFTEVRKAANTITNLLH